LLPASSREILKGHERTGSGHETGARHTRTGPGLTGEAGYCLLLGSAHERYVSNFFRCGQGIVASSTLTAGSILPVSPIILDGVVGMVVRDDIRNHPGEDGIPSESYGLCQDEGFGFAHGRREYSGRLKDLDYRCDRAALFEPRNQWQILPGITG